MKYMILDYSKAVSPTKKKNKMYKHFRIYQQYEKYKQYKQLVPERKDIAYCEMEFVYITLPLNLRKLRQLSFDKVQKRIMKTLSMTNERCPLAVGQTDLLAVQPGLEPYVPSNIPICEDIDEVYIIILEHLLENLCNSQNLTKNTSTSKINKVSEDKNFFKRDAGLLFLDDGTKDAMTYIKHLSKDWNYVTVCSNRHEELDILYRELYEEEGLMVQCADYRCNRYKGQCAEQVFSQKQDPCRGDVVIDLTSDWHGIHHLYPKNAYVFDITFSQEKEMYLKAKQVSLAGYVQAANLSSQSEYCMSYPQNTCKT